MSGQVTQGRMLIASIMMVVTLGAVAVWAAEAPPGGSAPAAAATQPTSRPDARHPRVALETTLGTIVLELDREKAPVTVENFLRYVEDRHYDDTIFHRVIDGFMIQGGGMTAGMKEKPTKASIKNEWNNGLKNKRGTIAMARTQAPDSATAQFFINTVDNDRLSMPISGNAGYAVFGKVVEGMDVVDKIAKVEVRIAADADHVPKEPVLIKRAKRL